MMWAPISMAQDKQILDAAPGPVDTNTVLQAFKKGKTTGHFRYFFMATNNAKGLSDYYAHALGGGLKYETASFHKLKAGIGGFFIFNIGSTDFADADALTGQFSRYESSLFDINYPNSKNPFTRLEELYLKYSSEKFTAVFGKQLINTPFINSQDGRMRPTDVEGLFSHINLNNKWQIQAGWLYKVSPRGTLSWYTVAHSIGIYPQGKNRNGMPGNYKGNLQSIGTGLLGIIFKPKAGIQLKIWEQFTENIFNTLLFQADVSKSFEGSKLSGALQYIRQDVINDGGNTDPSKAYFEKNNQVNVFGARIGFEQKNWEATLNFTRIANGGRLTMPREWGIEPLFTFLPRERNEGLGNMNAAMANVKAIFPAARLKIEVGYGHYYLPDIKNYALNKYSLPSYRHIKLLADHQFNQMLQGLDISMLLVYKGKLQPYLPPAFIINKVDMMSYNVIVNYHF